MSMTACSVISDVLKAIGIEYGFMSYDKKPIRYPYFVGEYTETEPYTEDGMVEIEFLLNGFTRGTWLSIEEAKEQIKQNTRHYAKRQFTFLNQFDNIIKVQFTGKIQTAKEIYNIGDSFRSARVFEAVRSAYRCARNI